MKGFIEFIRKQGVVGFAAGFIVGSAVTKLVSAFVADFITPFVGLFFNTVKGLKNFAIPIGPEKLLVGDFISNFLDFLVVAFVVYTLVHVLKLDRLDKKVEEKK